MSVPDFVPCPSCGSPIPQDFTACPRCHHEPPAAKTKADVWRERLSTIIEETHWLVLGVTIGVGVLSQFIVYMECTAKNGKPPMDFTPWVGLVGAAFMVQAAMIMVKRKNRHWAWGFLGLLSIPGLLIAHMIGIRCESCGQVYSRFKAYCQPCDKRGMGDLELH